MRIVYATDGSPGATRVAEFLALLPLTPADTISMLAVCPDLSAAEIAAVFDEPRRLLARSPARVEQEQRSGSAAEGIVRYAKEQEAGLIALGALGSTNLVEFFIGSVAERVLRHAECPVLTVRSVRHRLQRALVGLDGSDTAKEILRALAALPLPGEMDLRLATVLPSTEAVVGAAPMIWSSLVGEVTEILEGAMKEAEDRLREQASVLQQAGKRVSAEVLRGEPAASLMNAADHQEVDLIVVGSRGEGGLDRFLLGSVSERVARHANCSVLVVR